MATKEEYIEALDQMEEVYYNFDNCISAMNKFKECVNLLTGLVNEHFKENIETNFEHFKDGIIEVCIDELAISKGKALKCCAIPCSECDFQDKNGHCIGNHEIMKWLKQPYKKSPYKLSKFEFDIIQTYRNCHEICKFSDFKQLMELKDKGYFQYVYDNTNIQDIIANCEVVG